IQDAVAVLAFNVDLESFFHGRSYRLRQRHHPGQGQSDAMQTGCSACKPSFRIGRPPLVQENQ
ncbi:MAG: hypothetical protein WA129_12890, partial [Acidovorax sp.]